MAAHGGREGAGGTHKGTAVGPPWVRRATIVYRSLDVSSAAFATGGMQHWLSVCLPLHLTNQALVVTNMR